jgi:hypothetical protein
VLPLRAPDVNASRTALISAVAALALVLTTATVHAGGGINEPHEHTEEDGPTYFGFVRDMRNTPLNDAKVTLKIASGLTYVTRTDRSGMYRVRGLGNQVKPAEVVITCTKDGYQQIRVVRRPLPRGKAVKSVETECRMQRQ